MTWCVRFSHFLSGYLRVVCIGNESGYAYVWGAAQQPPRITLRSHARLASAAGMSHSHIDPASKCFLGGLSYSSTDETLREYFQKFGEVWLQHTPAIAMNPAQLNHGPCCRRSRMCTSCEIA